MRTLAIDLGARRVGIAVCDSEGRLASPLEVLEVSSPADAMSRVKKIIQREQPRRVVVGLPLNMDDTVGPAARSTAKWGHELARQAGLPVVFVDERLSSFAAEKLLVDRKRAGESLTRGKKKRRLDALAAAAFLQDYLDGKLAALHIGGGFPDPAVT